MNHNDLIDEIPKRGDMVKVCLPGETPYAICVEEREGSWMGCILNKLFREYSEIEKAKFTGQHFGRYDPLPDLHTYKKFDVVEFVPASFEFRGGQGWEPKK